MMHTVSTDAAFERFRSARMFPALDGLRAVSILMVLTVHMHDPFLWGFFDGSLGVTMFFCISGFLITTLLLREQDRTGAVSLKGFYIRRVFRIVPLYFLALGLASALVLGLKLGSGGSDFLQRLPLLATFNGEFAGSGTFSHSWSLGIEEKFYLVWPLLAFAIPVVRRRLGILLVVLVPAAFVAAFLPSVGYFGIYMPIIGGCALAVAMHHRRSFAVVYQLSRPGLAGMLFVVMLLMSALNWYMPLRETSGYAHVFFAVFVLLSLPGLIVGRSWARRALSTSVAVWYGNLAYGIYLFHPFVGEVADKVWDVNSGDPAVAVGRFLLVFVGSLALAVVLKRAVEDPFIRIGRKLARNETAVATVPSDPVRALVSSKSPVQKAEATGGRGEASQIAKDQEAPIRESE